MERSAQSMALVRLLTDDDPRERREELRLRLAHETRHGAGQASEHGDEQRDLDRFAAECRAQHGDDLEDEVSVDALDPLSKPLVSKLSEGGERRTQRALRRGSPARDCAGSKPLRRVRSTASATHWPGREKVRRSPRARVGSIRR